MYLSDSMHVITPMHFSFVHEHPAKMEQFRACLQ